MELDLNYFHSTIKPVKRKWNCPDLGTEEILWQFSIELFLEMTEYPMLWNFPGFLPKQETCKSDL